MARSMELKKFENFTYQCCNALCAVILALACVITSFILLPGIHDLAADIGALQNTVAPVVKEGAGLAGKARALVIPKVDEVATPVNNTHRDLAKVNADFKAKITETRDAIFEQGKLYEAAGGNVATQTAIIAKASGLYDALATEAKNMASALEPVNGLETLLNDAHAMSIVKKVSAVVHVVGGLYHAIVHAYHVVQDVAKFFGGSVKSVNFPNLPFAKIDDVLKKVHTELKAFTTSVDKLADEIAGEIPKGAFHEPAVATRIQEIANNLRADGTSTVDSEEMRATVAFKEFNRNTDHTDTTLVNGYYILGNASEALGGVRTGVEDGTALIEKVSAQLDKTHDYPAYMNALIHGQVVVCLVIGLWVIFYACARNVLPKSVSAVLYAISHFVLQVFVGYCLLLLIVIVTAKAIFDLLANGQCQGDFIVEQKYTTLCRTYVFPTDKALNNTFHAAIAMVILAYYLLMVYHTFGSEHLPNEEDGGMVKLQDHSDYDSDEE